MKNIKKKNIFIILLVVILFLAATGYSAWVIINIKDIDYPAEYNYRELVTKEIVTKNKRRCAKIKTRTREYITERKILCQYFI